MTAKVTRIHPKPIDEFRTQVQLAEGNLDAAHRARSVETRDAHLTQAAIHAQLATAWAMIESKATTE